MSDLAARFHQKYEAALGAHLSTAGEEGLTAAYDLGRWAMSNGLGLLDVVEAHQNVARKLASTRALGTGADQFLLQSLAAFEMAQRGFSETRERVKVEEALVTKLQAVTAGSIAILARVTSEERLTELVEQARVVVGASHAALQLSGDGSPFYATAPGPLDEALRRILRDAAASGTPARVDGSGSGSYSVLCVPALVDRSHIQGALLAWGGRRFDASDEAALHQLATMGTIAWDNARVFEQEHGISLTLQQSLLPEAIPAVPGLSIATRYVPSGPGSQVGGDWYDVIELDGGQIGLVVGDVMGHDIKAAAVMGQLRLALRAYALDGYGPAEVIDRVDRLLDRLDSSQCASVIYAVLDPRSGRLAIVNAGHPQPVLVDPAGQAEFLAAGCSIFLGLPLLGPGHHEERLVIGRGATLLFYTDGLIESRNRSIEEGMAALQAAAASFDGSPEELCENVLARVPSGGLHDDVCLLAVHLKG